MVFSILWDGTENDMKEKLRMISRDSLLMGSLILSFAFGVSTLALLLFHTYILLNNYSTIEITVLLRNNIFFEKSRYHNWI